MTDILKTIADKQKQLKEVLTKQHMYSPKMLMHLNIKITYNSNALEGNTLSMTQTATFIEKSLTAEGKTINEHFEAINHYNAFNYVFNRRADKSPYSTKDILNIHSIILDKINDAEKGKFRNTAVRILGSDTILPNYAKVPLLMDKLDNSLKDDDKNPIMKAIDAHYDLVTIHPFIDGNGRTARLLLNGILMQNKYPPLILTLEQRSEYLSSLEKAQTTGDKQQYTDFMCKEMNKSMDYYLEMKKEFHLTLQINKGKER